MQLPKINLHIHSNYSDGKQTIKQIVQKSIKLKLDYIAITDHFTNSWKAWVSTLKDPEIISSYLEEILHFQEFLKQHNKQLTLLKGIEVDIASSEQFIKNNLEADKFDLILFEYLQSPESIAFIENLIYYWKLTELNKMPILGLAHFDPSYFIIGDLDPLMIFLKKYNIYFEFNSSYPSFYSTQYKLFFEKLKEYKIPVAIGCDSHNLGTLDDIDEPFEMIRYYNLESNFKILIDLVKLKKI
ncbi:MAG: PHP domain-containing protein [Candidatus Hodarchaeota archaeon]